MCRWIVCGVAAGREESSTLAVAARLTERLGGRLAIVAVEPEPMDPTVLRDYLDDGARVIEQATRGADVADDAVHRVETGDPAEGLMRTADELSADLFVVGAPRRSGMSALLSPGVPSRLVENGRRPVVVVPEGGREAFRSGMGLSGTVVCGVDGAAGPRLGRFATSLASDLGVRPVLVTAVAPHSTAALASGPGAAAALPEATEQARAAAAGRLAELAELTDEEVERITAVGDPVETLEEVARRKHACAIVIASRGRGRLARALLGSVTARLPRRADRPVVVLPSA